ncbi:MAG: hypothetical protein J0L64_05115 [Acidobacteria bacterium]|nr:hypothetical protein [Acidobacteriota bacterium]
MDSTTHGYSHWGCARIALREAGPRFVEAAMGVFPILVLLAAMNPQTFWGRPAAMFLLMPAVELVRVMWRWWRLRGVTVAFDGEHLRMVGHYGVRGLAAYEVAAYLNTSRYLYIVPGRTNYEMTIYTELEGFEAIREQILGWIPPSAEVVPPPARRRLRSAVWSSLRSVAFVLALLWCYKTLGLSLRDSMIFMAVVVFVWCAWSYFHVRKAEPPPEERYNLPPEFVW